jgi:bifunctional DNA-binding transcriptional regulator/antitoxin component of YhaV-PrlF toxin-antitoxin module
MPKLLRILGRRGRITIPYEIRKRVGFVYNDVLSFTEAKDGRTVIVRREKICDDCVAREPAPVNEKIALEHFLDDLSADQQRQALVHLSMRWAEKQGGESNA